MGVGYTHVMVYMWRPRAALLSQFTSPPLLGFQGSSSDHQACVANAITHCPSSCGWNETPNPKSLRGEKIYFRSQFQLSARNY